MNLESGDIVLCTVDRIVGTTVFVHIEGNGKDLEGSIVFSEIAPGRIRNIRDYVFPKKKIICKVLRISGDRIDLSLRRVTLKEQKELREKHRQEKSFLSILRTVLKDDAEKKLGEITKKTSLGDFLQEIKENPKELEKSLDPKSARKILEILGNQKHKKAVIKKEISLKSQDENGLEKIKQVLGNLKEIEVRYISAGKYSLRKEDSDIKQADQKLREILETLEKKTKTENLDFSIIKK